MATVPAVPENREKRNTMETDGVAGMDALESARAAMFSPRRVPLPGGDAGPAPDAVADLGADGTAVWWGDRRDAGGTVLVVHGWEGATAQFAWLAARLASAGVSVVGVDAPGHGRAADRPFSSVRHARGLLRAQDRFGPFVGVVAHSLGSVAMHVARLDGLRTPSLALLAPVRSMSEQVAGLADRLRIAPVRRDEFGAMVVSGLGRPVAALDLDTAPAPDCPVLVCHDRDDRIVPVSSSRELVRAWPHAELRESSGLRHHGLLEDPATLERVVGHLLSRVVP